MGIAAISVLIFLLVLIVCSVGFIFYRLNLRYSSLESVLNSLWDIQSVVLSTTEFEEMVSKVTNIILTDLNYMKLGYIIVVLALVDERKQVLRRIGISQTKEAAAFLKSYPLPYRSIEIPLSETRNIGIKVLNEGQVMLTNNVSDLLYPAVDPHYVSHLQKEVGLQTSVVFPVTSRGKKKGILIFSMKKKQDEIKPTEWAVMKNFVGSVGIAVENAQLFEALNTSNRALSDTNNALKLANSKLEELDQLKDDFVSVASHELRTPMTAIRSYAWMALNRSDVPLTDKLKKYLGRTLISTERLINLVNEMLNISRIESGRIEILPEAFDIRSLVDEVLIEVGPKAAEKKLNLRVYSSQIPKVYADVDKVHQILLNLIGNAMKFTPNEGDITVGFFSDGFTVDVSVKDSGVGISRDDLSRLFKKFGRLDNSYVAAATSGGTGLGLYISKSLVDRMGGRIWAVSSGLGKGSSFTFSLPIATKEVLTHAEKYSNKVAENQVKYLEPVAI